MKDATEIGALRTAFRHLFAEDGTMAERLDSLVGAEHAAVTQLIAFVRGRGNRPLCQPRV